MLRLELLRLVFFQEGSRFLQVEDVSVDRQLIFTGVFRDGDDSFYAMAVGSEGLDEEIDIYHAEEFTGCRFR
jgi:hypothetical protein